MNEQLMRFRKELDDLIEDGRAKEIEACEIVFGLVQEATLLALHVAPDFLVATKTILVGVQSGIELFQETHREDEKVV